jgi:hypothetical protein
VNGLRLAAFVAVSLVHGASVAVAWDVGCQNDAGEKCEGPFEIAQTPWVALQNAEHRQLLDLTILYAGLPTELRQQFSVEVFALDDELTDDDDRAFPSVRPVLIDSERRRSRQISIPAMANLPDFSYTFWDLAAGNELCPPDPSESDMVECHNYETHIGWLNSNHMLPQSRKWYEHMHAIALRLADSCKDDATAVPLALRDRYERYLKACEKQALLIEGVGHHYLQDSWSVGHLWERWGGTEEQDFGGNQALGFAVAAFTGLIHGGKAVFDHTPVFSWFAPWDDPICAPHENVEYVDHGVEPVEKHHGAGDIFMPELLGVGAAAAGDKFGPQRRAMFGCAADGIRAVYDATAKLHGPLGAADPTKIDSSRSVGDDSCWAQRVTNAAIAEGCGVHQGEAPNATRFIPDEEAGMLPAEFSSALMPLLIAQLRLAPLVAGAPLILNPVTLGRFQLDASYACTLALTHAMIPEFRDQTNLASGGLPALAGIRPNSAYARGNPATDTPPAFYADPFPPWSLSEVEDPKAPRKEVLNLFYADANAAQRCRDFTVSRLEEYVDAVDSALEDGPDSGVIDARCGQCVQMIAPHLRHGKPGNYDTRREAFCALVAPSAASYIYTDENPASFTGTEPLTYAALEEAALVRCHCEEGPTTTTTTVTSTTTTTIPSVIFDCPPSGGAGASAMAQIDASEKDECSDDGTTVLYPPSYSDADSCHALVSGEDQSSSATGNGSVSLNLNDAVKIYPDAHLYGATGATVNASGTGSVTNTPAGSNTFSRGGGGGGVRCRFWVTGTIGFEVSASGSFSGNGAAEARFLRVDGGQPIASLAVRQGVNNNNFPKSGTIGTGTYEFSANASAAQQLSSGTSSANISFSLNLTPP